MALLAVAYRVVIGVGAAWLTARLAPNRPMRPAIILGAIGVVLGLAGLAATWSMGHLRVAGEPQGIERG